jgi:hypothetical protein
MEPVVEKHEQKKLQKNRAMWHPISAYFGHKQLISCTK